MSFGFRTFTRGATTKWSVWKFNWLANHKIIRALERARPHAHGTLVDVGCGWRPFEPIFAKQVERYFGTELSGSKFLGVRHPDVFARAEALPFRDASVDTVLSLSVINCLPEPLALVTEAHRILRPGGVLLLEMMQMAPLHDEPDDYYRFTRYAALDLLGRAGFEPPEFIPIGGLWARVGLTTIAALNRLNRGPTRILTELPVRVLYIVLQLAFEGLDQLFFDEREVLSHLVVARRK